MFVVGPIKHEIFKINVKSVLNHIVLPIRLSDLESGLSLPFGVHPDFPPLATVPVEPGWEAKNTNP